MKEFTINLDCERHEWITLDYEILIARFNEQGWKVTKEALEHNFWAWKADRKSGYRDDENGYFLFTPCGCNKLSFTATEIKDDHKTYEA